MDSYDRFQVRVIIALLLFTLSFTLGIRLGDKYINKNSTRNIAKDLNEYLGTSYEVSEVADNQTMVDLINSLESQDDKEKVTDILGRDKQSIFSDTDKIYRYINEGKKLELVTDENQEEKKFEIMNKKILINIIILSLIVSIIAVLEGYTVSFLISLIIVCIYIIYKLFF